LEGCICVLNVELGHDRIAEGCRWAAEREVACSRAAEHRGHAVIAGETQVLCDCEGAVRAQGRTESNCCPIIATRSYRKATATECTVGRYRQRALGHRYTPIIGVVAVGQSQHVSGYAVRAIDQCELARDQSIRSR